MSNDFSDVKAGDRLWMRTDEFEGWGEVDHIGKLGTSLLTIGVCAPERKRYDKYNWFTIDGKSHKDGPQCLFYGPPEIIAPPKLTRMKKVKIRVQVLKSEGDLRVSSINLHTAGTPCGPVQTVEIEVEE